MSQKKPLMSYRNYKFKFPPGDHYSVAYETLASPVSLRAEEDGVIVAVGSISKAMVESLEESEVSFPNMSYVVDYKTYEAITGKLKYDEDVYIEEHNLFPSVSLEKETSPEMQTIHVWPDYDWCFEESLDSFLQFKSDDYISVKLPLSEDEPSDDFLRANVDGPNSLPSSLPVEETLNSIPLKP